jgi:hypothetical protein
LTYILILHGIIQAEKYENSENGGKLSARTMKVLFATLVIIGGLYGFFGGNGTALAESGQSSSDVLKRTAAPISIIYANVLNSPFRYQASARERSEEKLNSIIFKEVIFDGEALANVVRKLNEALRNRYPQQKGQIVGIAPPGKGNLKNIEKATITCTRMTDLSLAQVLELIARCSSTPLVWTVQEDGAVVFSEKPENPGFPTRLYKVEQKIISAMYEKLLDKKKLNPPTPTPRGDGIYILYEPDTTQITIAAVIRQQTGIDFSSSGRELSYNGRLGMMLIRATKEELDKIEQLYPAFKPTSIPPALPESEEFEQQFTSHFRVNPATGLQEFSLSPELLTRTFKVDPKSFSAMYEEGLDDKKLNPPTPVQPPTGGGVRSYSESDHPPPMELVRQLIHQKTGFDLSGSGRALFYNDRLGVLLIRATKEEFAKIEKFIETINQKKTIPPSH